MKHPQKSGRIVKDIVHCAAISFLLLINMHVKEEYEKEGIQVRFCYHIQRTLDITKGQGTGKICTLVTRFCYIEVLFRIFYYCWGKENLSLYRELHYI